MRFGALEWSDFLPPAEIEPLANGFYTFQNFCGDSRLQLAFRRFGLGHRGLKFGDAVLQGQLIFHQMVAAIGQLLQFAVYFV